ncbi:MAG TPA: GTPase ObgE [Actinomycetota bacterium]|nr:GTPase ObgE [Actinomycetota bacterium]
MFVDEVRVKVNSGKGGDGAVTFHREKYRPKGGPDGGNGGKGGSVIFEAVMGRSSLSWLKDHPHQKAPNGGKGSKNNSTGKDADDLVVPVPVGTLFFDEKGTLLADLALPGDRAVVARGGRGGRGNAAFKSQRRRAPGFSELGEPGESMWLKLELSLIADVTVIGFPNAGKSTLVGAVSAATPKVADYAFTTLEPSLGVVQHGDLRFTICDVPGLVEGAHTGRGLGIKFLRHAERALVFLHLIDASSERDPLNDYDVIRKEIGSYDISLLSRPEVVVLNKADLVTGDKLAVTVERFKSRSIGAIGISAETREGVDELMEMVGNLVAKTKAERPKPSSYELMRAEAEPLSVERDGEAWKVKGGQVDRWVAMTDLNNAEAVSYLQQRLEKAGVEKLLEKAGASYGDDVKIGPASFEWWPAGQAP